MVVELPGRKFISGTVSAGEFVLDYAEAGPPGAAVTLISFPGSAGIEMSTAKDRLSERHRVVEINPPGWGGRDDLQRRINMPELGAVLAEAANRLVEGPYYIIGTSMGGVNAIHAAEQHPARVLGLILEGGMAPATSGDLIVQAPNDEDVAAGRMGSSESESEGPQEYPLPPVDPRKPWADEKFIRTQMQNRFKMFAWVDLDMLPEAVLGRVSEQNTPIVALVGDDDEILRPSQRETFAQYLPAAEFRNIPGAHDLQNTNPDEFVAIVEDFVSADRE